MHSSKTCRSEGNIHLRQETNVISCMDLWLIFEYIQHYQRSGSSFTSSMWVCSCSCTFASERTTRGPPIESKTGNRTNPCNRPNKTSPKNTMKTVKKISDEEKPSGNTPINVETPPTMTLAPMVSNVFFTFSSRLLPSTSM